MLGAPCWSRWVPFGSDGDHVGLNSGALGLIWVTAWKALGAIRDPLGLSGCSNELFGSRAGGSINLSAQGEGEGWLLD